MIPLVAALLITTLTLLCKCQSVLEATRPQTFIQASEMSMFLHRVNKQEGNNFLHLELYITDNIDRPNKRAQALIIRDGEPCGLSTSLYTGDESNLKYTAIDRNGFYLKKSYHHIVLPLTQGFKNGEIYICIVNNVGLSYQGNSEYQFTYLLKATYSEKRPCANKCGGNGACDNVGVCICSSDNFADEDCSANVNLIQTGQEIFATIGPTRWMYFKASSPKGSPIITLKKPDSVLMRVSFKIPGEGGIWMPNLQEGTIIVQNSAQSWKADKSTFLIGVFNPTELAVDFNLKAVSDETGGGLYFALIVLVGFVGAAICVSILAIVCLRRCTFFSFAYAIHISCFSKFDSNSSTLSYRRK
eukprot:TRINITY_DN586_c0_g2_i5.p1 TRINITY_DN586_c0_g2~~TRINITY_DN586_c0_g2_i5.p1  ORF type:complete len:358 (-),score=24.16 TRINITY_DN586_c0_g2_i5:197-1270(-)